jgi:hypothetical protein
VFLLPVSPGSCMNWWRRPISCKQSFTFSSPHIGTDRLKFSAARWFSWPCHHAENAESIATSPACVSRSLHAYGLVDGNLSGCMTCVAAVGIAPSTPQPMSPIPRGRCWRFSMNVSVVATGPGPGPITAPVATPVPCPMPGLDGERHTYKAAMCSSGQHTNGRRHTFVTHPVAYAHVMLRK